MFRRLAGVFLIAGVTVLLSGRPALAQAREVVIASPKGDAKVGQFEEVEGKLNVQEGWPVVLVQPLVGGQPWYVQGAVDEVASGKFTSKVQFGNEKTKAGTKFRIVIVVARDKAAAQKFEA